MGKIKNSRHYLAKKNYMDFKLLSPRIWKSDTFSQFSSNVCAYAIGSCLQAAAPLIKATMSSWNWHRSCTYLLHLKLYTFEVSGSSSQSQNHNCVGYLCNPVWIPSPAFGDPNVVHFNSQIWVYYIRGRSQTTFTRGGESFISQVL